MKPPVMPNWMEEELRSPTAQLLQYSTRSLPAVDIGEETGHSSDTFFQEIRTQRSEMLERRSELTARSGVAAGAGFEWGERDLVADFEQVKAKKAEIARHQMLARSELATYVV